MSKIPWQNPLAELSENTCNKYISSKSAGLQLATYFLHSFIFWEFSILQEKLFSGLPLSVPNYSFF